MDVNKKEKNSFYNPTDTDTKYQYERSTDTKYQVAKNKNNNKVLIIITVISFTCIVISSIYLMRTKDKDPSKEPERNAIQVKLIQGEKNHYIAIYNRLRILEDNLSLKVNSMAGISSDTDDDSNDIKFLNGRIIVNMMDSLEDKIISKLDSIEKCNREKQSQTTKYPQKTVKVVPNACSESEIVCKIHHENYTGTDNTKIMTFTVPEGHYIKDAHCTTKGYQVEAKAMSSKFICNCITIGQISGNKKCSLFVQYCKKNKVETCSVSNGNNVFIYLQFNSGRNYLPHVKTTIPQNNYTSRTETNAYCNYLGLEGVSSPKLTGRKVSCVCTIPAMNQENKKKYDTYHGSICSVYVYYCNKVQGC